MKVEAVRVEDVFKTSGVPTYTFEEPVEFRELVIALRTSGRGVIVEGPSGIGKTTAVKRALEAHGIDKFLDLSGRRKDDLQWIELLIGDRNAGTVIIDDFHRLADGIRREIGDFLKLLADEECKGTKLIVIGINRSGDSLVYSSPDLNSRVSTVRIGKSLREKVVSLLSKGERALNISLTDKQRIADAANGSFLIAQTLAQKECVERGVIERSDEHVQIPASYELVRAKLMEDLDRKYFFLARCFAQGSKLRKEGRAPYLHILKWLAESGNWSIHIMEESRKHQMLRGSVVQVVEKGFLAKLFEDNSDLQSVLHFDALVGLLSTEDPQFVYYLQNLPWAKFGQRVGFVSLTFKERFDYALSFAGSCRPVAERLRELLKDREIHVFYDRDAQHEIIGAEVETYLGRIYESDAAFVVAILNKDFSHRVWTNFESERFSARFGECRVIPILCSDAVIMPTDRMAAIGRLSLDLECNVEEQLVSIADTLSAHIMEFRARFTPEVDEGP